MTIVSQQTNKIQESKVAQQPSRIHEYLDNIPIPQPKQATTQNFTIPNIQLTIQNANVTIQNLHVTIPNAKEQQQPGQAQAETQANKIETTEDNKMSSTQTHSLSQPEQKVSEATPEKQTDSSTQEEKEPMKEEKKQKKSKVIPFTGNQEEEQFEITKIKKQPKQKKARNSIKNESKLHKKEESSIKEEELTEEIETKSEKEETQEEENESEFYINEDGKSKKSKPIPVIPDDSNHTEEQEDQREFRRTKKLDRNRKMLQEEDENLEELHFDPLVVRRRAAQGLIPGVEDPEINEPWKLSSLKSSRRYKISEDGTTTSLEGGYRLIRATHGFKTPGKYYWETQFRVPFSEEELAKKEEKFWPHVRIGISTLRAKVEFPCGSDDRGYSVRNTGGKFHARKEVGESKPFQPGDSVGLGYCIEENKTASLHMWINGKYEGLLFDGIDATKRWFPTFSLYGGAEITVNFHAKEDSGEWMPACDAPNDTVQYSLTAEKLIKYMDNYAKNKHKRTPEINRAIFIVMTPPEEMPA